MPVTSIIAEGFERKRRTEFHPLLPRGKAPGAEVESQGHMVYGIAHIGKATLEVLLRRGGEVARVIGGLGVCAEKQRHVGK